MNNSIGQKIKTFREEANVSLQDMASKIGLSIPKLELIESANVSPTISILTKITRLLGIRLGTLLDGEEQTDPVVSYAKQSVPTINTTDGNAEDSKNLNFFSLASNKKDRNMEPLVIDVTYVEPQTNLSNHEGEEFIYVLDGELNIVYGTKNYILTKGDSIYYDSVVPHVITTANSEQTAKILSVTYTPL